MAFVMEKQKTGSTPYIFINEQKGYMRFEGESFHENVISFYKEVDNWLGNYLKSNFCKFTFDCELKYFNSSTAKYLLNMLIKMDDCSTDDKNVTVNWITSEDNDIIIECGEDFKEEMCNLTFNMIVK